MNGATPQQVPAPVASVQPSPDALDTTLPAAPAIASPTSQAPAAPLVGVNALKSIPHADMTAAYKSGAWSPHEGEDVPVSYDGKIRLAPADKLQNAVEHGAEIVHPDILHKAVLEKRYGEHGTLGATVAGGLRGLSLGTLDPIALAAADAVGGEAAKAGLQERLGYYKREHPVASTVGEIGGMIAPALLTGGASAEVEGAGLAARGVAGADEAVDAARAVGALGEGAEAAQASKAAGYVAGQPSVTQVASTAERYGLGTTEAVDVARAETSPSLLTTAARALGAPVKMLGEAGKLAERGAGALVGPEADSLLGRIAQKAVTQSAKLGVEGGIIGDAQEISEDSLDPDKNHALTAEKLFSAFGHGALLNAALGGALGAGGEAASDALEAVRAKASPFLHNAAGERMWKAVAGGAGGQKITEEAERRVEGGIAGAGRAVMDAPLADGSTVLPKTGSLTDAAMTPEQLLVRITDAHAVAGEKIGAILDKYGAKARVGDVMSGIESVIAPFRKTAGNESLVRSLEEYRDSLYDKLYADFRAPERFEIGLADSETKAPAYQKAIGIERGPDRMHAIDFNAGIAEQTEDQLAEGLGGKPLPSPFKIDMTRPGHIGDGVGIDPKMSEGTIVGPNPVEGRTHYDVGLKSSALVSEEDAKTAAMDSMREKRAELRAKGVTHGPVYDDAIAEAAHDAATKARGPIGRGPIKIAADDAATAKAEREARKNFEVPIRTLFANKRALGDIIYREGSPLNPSQRVEQLRDIYGKMADAELETVDRAAADAGKVAGEGRAELRDARHTYQSLSLAKRAAEKSAAGAAKNNSIGLPDYLSAGMAAASGHIVAAPVIAVGQKFVRMRADAMLAATFDRLSVLQSIAKKTAAVDAELGRGVKAFVSRAKGEEPKIRPREPMADRPKSSRDARAEYEATVVKLAQAGKGADFGASSSALAAHAPNVALNLAQTTQRAAAWLASRVPPAPKYGSKTPSDQEVYTFNEEARAVEAPGRTIANGLANGLSRRQVDAVRAVSPELVDSVESMLQARMKVALAADKTLPWDVRRDMALLFDIDSDWSMSPAGMKTLQDNAQKDPQTNEQKPNRRSAPVQTPEATTMQTDVQRREGGQIR